MAGYVCISFDDNGDQRYHNAYPMLAAANIPATFFVASDFIGSGGQLTAAMLLEMQAGGMEIGSHALNSAQMTSYTAEQAEAAFANSKSALEALGLTIDSFAYPGYSWTLALAAVGKTYYRWQRVGTTYFIDFAHLTAGTNVVASYADANALATMDKLKEGVDRAIKNDSVVIFTIHNVLADGTLEDNPAVKLQDMIAYILDKQASAGLQAIRMTDLSDLVTAEGVWEWIAEEAGSLSDGTKWDKGTAPGAGAHIVLSGASSQNMTIDVAETYGDITIGLEYAGTVTKNNVAIGYGDWRQQGGSSTYTPHSTPYETCSKNWNKSGGTLTTDVLRLKMTGVDVYESNNQNGGLHSLDIVGRVKRDSLGTLTANYNLYIREGARLGLIKSDGHLSWKSYNGGAYQNLGEIYGAATFKYLVYNAAAPTWNPGIVRCPVMITNFGAGPTVNVTVKLTGKLQPGKAILVHSTNATYSITLDTQGNALTHAGLSLGSAKSGIVLGASKVLAYGNLDTSAGAADFGTSQYIQAGAGTIKTAAGQKLQHLVTLPSGSVKLLSALVVSGRLIKGADNIDLNGNALTLEQPEELYDRCRVVLDTELGGGPAPYGPEMYALEDLVEMGGF